jgi:hypothetical protein
MFACLVLTVLQALGSVSGFVTDASNGEKLTFANVYLEDQPLGSATNEKGYYYMHNVPTGTFTVVFSYIGYETQARVIEMREGENIQLNVELTPTSIALEEVTVSAERVRFEKEVEVSHVTFLQREIQSIPGLFEKDLIKSLQLMPGIVTMHDLSNKLYVRGGSPDENLVLLDGITVYNPSAHLFGLFSTFNPDVVGDAQLYAGGFPAEFGNRLSSVLNITTKEGNSKRVAGEASFGLVTSKIMVEGPIPKGSFLVSGRRTYFDALVWAYSKIWSDTISLPYYFYDGIMKINYNPSPENRFTIAGLGGEDVMEFEIEDDDGPDEEIDFKWGNRGLSLRWRRVLSPSVYGEMLGAWSNFLTTLTYTDFHDPLSTFYFHEEIIDYTLKCDFNWFLGETHTVDFGIDGKALEIDYDVEVADENLFNSQDRVKVLSGYFQDTWSVMPDIVSVRLGMRGLYYGFGSRFALDPRIGLKYHVAANTALNLSCGRYTQYLMTSNSQESYFSIFDFWRPVDSTHSLPVAYHVICGVEQWFDQNTKCTIEPYYKKYYNLIMPEAEPEEGEFELTTPSESLATGSGYAMGIDFFFKKSIGKTFGWLSYSLGLTRRTVEDITYAPRYDRRHNLNIVFGFGVPTWMPVFRNGLLSLRWYVATGLPYAEDLARYRVYTEYGDYEWQVIKGSRDAYRLPLSHRLDAHFEKDIRLFGLNGSWYIDVMNVYNRKNIVFYTWDYDEDPPERNNVTLLPIPVPSIGITLRF